MQGKSSHSRPKLPLLQWMPRADLHVCVALLCQLLNGELSYAAIMKAAARVGLRQWFLTVMSDAGHIHYCQGSNSHIPPSRNVDWLTWEIYMRTRADGNIRLRQRRHPVYAAKRNKRNDAAQCCSDSHRLQSSFKLTKRQAPTGRMCKTWSRIKRGPWSGKRRSDAVLDR